MVGIRNSLFEKRTEIVAYARDITTKSNEQISFWHLVESKVLTKHRRGYKKLKERKGKCFPQTVLK